MCCLLQIRVREHTDNVAGVKIPKFDCVREVGDSKMDLTGLSAGGMQIGKCREAYQKTIELLVKLASLQSSFLTLDAAIKTTNRRVNALENVVKPRLANTISYIKVWHALLVQKKGAQEGCSQSWPSAQSTSVAN
jgi:V-type H+-transporting ATPase subunit D